MMLTLSQAAKLTGKSKSTLSRAIKNGKLSANRGDGGVFCIDPSELLRAFPKRNSENEASRSEIPFYEAVGTGEERAEVAALRDELAEARQRLAVAEALAEERAQALGAAERNLADLRRLLPPADVVRRRWWRFW